MQVLQHISRGVIISSLVLSLLSCNSSKRENAQNVVMHPIEEEIPYYDDKHLPIDTVTSFTQMQEKPEELILFHQYLKNPDKFAKENLEIMVGSPEPGFNVISLGQDRLVVLDPGNDKLIEYDLNTDDSVTIAEAGRGPGDIMYSKEMIKDEDFVYILGGNMQVSKFNYRSTPAEFSEVIPLKFRPSSVALSGDSLALLGTPDVSGASGNTTDNLENLKAVRLLDKKGNEVAQFGDSYDIDGHWMLLRSLVSDGMIRYSPKEHIFILAFTRFPLLYIYEATDLKLKNTYKISGFNLGRRRYWPDIGRLQITMEDHSLIKNTYLIDGQFLLLEVANRTNYRSGWPSWDHRMDYYVINLDSQETHYVGELEVDNDTPHQQFYFTENGLVIHKEGSLHLAEYLKVIK